MSPKRKPRLDKDAVDTYRIIFGDQEIAEQIVKDRAFILASDAANSLKKASACERDHKVASELVVHEDAEEFRNSYEATMLLLSNLTEDEAEAKKLVRERLD